jgi:peptide/nickel transport system substrate-binding protein
LSLVTLTYNLPDAITLAEAIKGMLAQVGINMRVDSLEPVAIIDRMKNLEYDMNFTGDGAMQDPDASAKNHYDPKSSFNMGRSANPKVLELLMAGRFEVDQEKRQKIYRQLEEELYHNYEDVWLTWGIGTIAFRKVVQGWNNDMWIAERTQYSRSHPLWFENGDPKR